MLRRALALAVFVLLSVPHRLPAQQLVARADTLWVAGRIFAAESLYYDAVRLEPRDPTARLALGRYLAARGALRVGAVLMEEARYFGGDAKLVAVQLAPVYERLGEFGALAALPSSRLSYAERTRAEWLRDNPASVDGPDSALVTYRVTDGQLLGRVMLHVGSDSLMATIDGRSDGLALDTSWARKASLKTFASRGDRDPQHMAAVATKVQVGAMTMNNVLVRFTPQRGLASIGLSQIGRLAPTFDPTVGTMLLRRSGRVADTIPGYKIATVTGPTGIEVVKTETTFPIGHPDIQRYLRTTRWTLNPRRGELVVEVPGSPAASSAPAP